MTTVQVERRRGPRRRADRLPRAVGWLLDWRNGVTLLGSVLLALLLVTVLDSIRARDRALDVAKATSAQALDQRAAQTRRIDQLSDQLADVNRQLALGAAQRGELLAQLAALIAQLRGLGVEPVVNGRNSDTTAGPSSRPSSRPSARPSSSPTARPSSRPSSSPRPTPSSTSRPCTRVLGICLPTTERNTTR